MKCTSPISNTDKLILTHKLGAYRIGKPRYFYTYVIIRLQKDD